MTQKLEIPKYNAERLAEIFESYIPFNKLLSVKRDNGDVGGKWDWQTD